MKRALLAATLLWPAAALAQSSPGWVIGQVPTAAQWNAVFAGKQDYPPPSASSINTGALAFPVTAAQTQFLTLDSSPQFFVGLIPGAAEYFNAMGGLAGNGGTLLATNGATGNVDANYAAQEKGGHHFGNGSGEQFAILDPGAPATANFTVTPAISGGAPQLSSSSGGMELHLNDQSLLTITENGGTVGVFGQLGSVTAAVAWLHFIPGQTGNNNAVISCEGNDPSNDTSCFIQARGNGTVVYSNAKGNLLTIASSSAATATSGLFIRAAQTGQPILLQGVSTNVAAGSQNGQMNALTTSATTGFFGIPVTAGTPTGVPVQASSGVAYVVFDSTNLKLCAYVTAWHCSAAFP